MTRRSLFIAVVLCLAPALALAATAVGQFTWWPITIGGSGTFPIGVSSNGRYLVTASGQPWMLIADSAQGLVGNVPICPSAGTLANSGGYTCTGTDPGYTAANSLQNYVNTRASQGFTAIQVDLLCEPYVNCSNHQAQTNGVDVADNQPFTSGTNQQNYLFGASPCPNCNPAYWNRIKAIVNIIGAAGMAAVLNPTPTDGCQTGTGHPLLGRRCTPTPRIHRRVSLGLGRT
jgi:hypothetical protein